MKSGTYYWLFFIWCYFKKVEGFSLPKLIKEKRENTPVKMVFIQSITLCNTKTNYNVDVGANISKIRVKRNIGAGKFVEAAQMPQIKLLRLFLQMFKNTWDTAYIGGSHPFHPDVPKTVVKLWKEKIVEFFIPDVGQELKVK